MPALHSKPIDSPLAWRLDAVNFATGFIGFYVVYSKSFRRENLYPFTVSGPSCRQL